MTEYFVTFYMKLSAKNEEELRKKAETTAETISKKIKKKINPHGYIEVEKTDKPKITLGDYIWTKNKLKQ